MRDKKHDLYNSVSCYTKNDTWDTLKTLQLDIRDRLRCYVYPSALVGQSVQLLVGNVFVLLSLPNATWLFGLISIYVKTHAIFD